MAKAEMSVANMAETNSGGGDVVSPGGSWIERAKEYYPDLKAEMGKVSWPSKEQVQATTAVVIACVFLFAFYFAVVDMILGRAIRRLFEMVAK